MDKINDVGAALNNTGASQFLVAVTLGLLIGWLIFKKHRDPEATAFSAPEGTVRAILALSIVGSYIQTIIVYRWSPEGLGQLASTMIGYYFGQAKIQQGSGSVQIPAAVQSLQVTQESSGQPPKSVSVSAVVNETAPPKEG